MLAAQGQAVGVDLVDAERHQVIHVALHFLDVADKEEDLQQPDVERVQAGVLRRLVDGAFDRRIEETLNARIEFVERHQRADLAQGHLLAGRLKGVKDRPLARERCRPVAPKRRIDSKILWISWN